MILITIKLLIMLILFYKDTYAGMITELILRHFPVKICLISSTVLQAEWQLTWQNQAGTHLAFAINLYQDPQSWLCSFAKE